VYTTTSLKGLTKRKINSFDRQHARLYYSLTFEPQAGIVDDKSKRSKNNIGICKH